MSQTPKSRGSFHLNNLGSVSTTVDFFFFLGNPKSQKVSLFCGKKKDGDADGRLSVVGWLGVGLRLSLSSPCLSPPPGKSPPFSDASASERWEPIKLPEKFPSQAISDTHTQYVEGS